MACQIVPFPVTSSQSLPTANLSLFDFFLYSFVAGEVSAKYSVTQSLCDSRAFCNTWCDFLILRINFRSSIMPSYDLYSSHAAWIRLFFVTFIYLFWHFSRPVYSRVLLFSVSHFALCVIVVRFTRLCYVVSTDLVVLSVFICASNLSRQVYDLAALAFHVSICITVVESICMLMYEA